MTESQKVEACVRTFLRMFLLCNMLQYLAFEMQEECDHYAYEIHIQVPSAVEKVFRILFKFCTD